MLSYNHIKVLEHYYWDSSLFLHQTAGKTKLAIPRKTSLINKEYCSLVNFLTSTQLYFYMNSTNHHTASFWGRYGIPFLALFLYQSYHHATCFVLLFCICYKQDDENNDRILGCLHPLKDDMIVSHSFLLHYRSYVGLKPQDHWYAFLPTKYWR